MNLDEYVQYHEIKQHGRPGFPYNTYLCSIPQDFDHVDLHWHEEMEIIYVKRGEGLITTGSDILPVTAGCIVPVLPSELHAIRCPEGGHMEYENIIFRLGLLDSREEEDWCRDHILGDLSRGTLQFPRPVTPGTAFHREAAAALDRADAACAQPVAGYPLIVKSCLFEFLYALYKNRAPVPQRSGGLHQENLKAVLRYVQEHFAEAITVADAAGISGYSEPHFMRFFKQETGRTFSAYLNEYRLRYASFLLKETEDPVSRIAFQCGFGNLSYFTRRFRRQYGVSPREYRKNSENVG